MRLLINSPNTNLFGPQFVKDDEGGSTQLKRPIPKTINPLSPALVQAIPLGRYGAPKPSCSMGQVN